MKVPRGGGILFAGRPWSLTSIAKRGSLVRAGSNQLGALCLGPLGKEATPCGTLHPGRAGPIPQRS